MWMNHVVNFLNVKEGLANKIMGSFIATQQWHSSWFRSFGGPDIKLVVWVLKAAHLYNFVVEGGGNVSWAQPFQAGCKDPLWCKPERLFNLRNLSFLGIWTTCIRKLLHRTFQKRGNQVFWDYCNPTCFIHRWASYSTRRKRVEIYDNSLLDYPISNYCHRSVMTTKLHPIHFPPRWNECRRTLSILFNPKMQCRPITTCGLTIPLKYSPCGCYVSLLGANV